MKNEMKKQQKYIQITQMYFQRKSYLTFANQNTHL